MKFDVFHWIAATTLLLILVTFLSVAGFSIATVFLLTVIGQVFLVIMVYKVLTDDYKTDKSFDDFYEDRPDLGARPETRDS